MLCDLGLRTTKKQTKDNLCSSESSSKFSVHVLFEHLLLPRHSVEETVSNFTKQVREIFPFKVKAHHLKLLSKRRSLHKCKKLVRLIGSIRLMKEKKTRIRSRSITLSQQHHSQQLCSLNLSMGNLCIVASILLEQIKGSIEKDFCRNKYLSFKKQSYHSKQLTISSPRSNRK